MLTLEVRLQEKVQTRLFETPEGERMMGTQRMREIVARIDEVQRETIMGYVPGRTKTTFLRIHVNSPDAVRPVRDCFHGYALELVGGRTRYLQLSKKLLQRDALRPSFDHLWLSALATDALP